jgi:predicted lipoprotein with Yx(FWY)xxD motif
MPPITRFLLPAIVASALLAACGSSSTTSTATKSSAPAASAGSVVKTASNSTLGSTVLVDSKGLTLYHLSVEPGKWICTTTACLQAWHPLTVATSAAPSGTVGSLATVKRPGNTLQVTYKGMPLYTFAGDKKPGQANGQGIKDVGTWTAATTGAAASAAPAKTTTSPASSSGGGYGY